MTDQAAATGELSFTRIFDAPRELVFRCMTEPEHLARFWGPTGVSAPLEHITVDLRPGGAFETVMINDADGSRYPTRAVYTEIVPPERLAWTEPDSGMTVTTTFTDAGGGRTEVRIHQTRVPEPYRSPEALAGFATSLDRFAAYVRGVAAWTQAAAGTPIEELIAGERRELAALLAALPDADWDAPSLCAGWRVREVVAHMTMPFRYSTLRFATALARARLDFAKMADRCARRDAAAPVAELVAALRDNERYRWQPPGAGLEGALTHDVIHGLDITTALGTGRRVPADRLRRVLASVTGDESRKHFGVDLTGIELRATDLDWSHGTGVPLAGQAQDLALVLCGRRLPAGRLSGEAAARFRAASTA